jgi:hypothetical protein
LGKKNTPTATTKAQLPGLWRTSGGLSIEDLGMVFLTYNNKRERRGEERRGEKSRAH